MRYQAEHGNVSELIVYNKYQGLTLYCGLTQHKFKVIKQVKGLTAYNVMKICKITFAEYKLPSKLMSDADINFVLEKSQDFCR